MKGACNRVKVICKRKSMQMGWLPRELGISSDVSVGVRFKLSVKMCRS